MNRASYDEVVRCPRCGRRDLPVGFPGAMSRADNATEICSECGQEEAILQWTTLGKVTLPGPSDWPISNPLRFTTEAKPRKKLIDVIYKRPGEEATVIQIDRDDLSQAQSLVGGYIEVVSKTGAILTIANEDGRRLNLPVHGPGIYGPFFVCRQKGEHFASVTNEDIAILLPMLNEMPR